VERRRGGLQPTVPAVLDYVKRHTGHDRVNWVGHSLGGMLIFPFLEFSPEAYRIANFVGMGSTITLADAPERDMLRANRGLRLLGRFVSTGRLGRPLMHFRFPGLDRIDQFYFTSEKRRQATTARFYGLYPGRSRLLGAAAARPYLESATSSRPTARSIYSVLLSGVHHADP